VVGIRPSVPLGSGEKADVLEVRVAAPPVDGAANAELLDVLAQALEIPRRDVQLVHGVAGRTKRVRILGLEPTEVLERLLPPANG
jgi:uncharacterized protein